MKPTLDDLHFLLTAKGQEELQKLAQEKITPKNHLQIATRLRHAFSAREAQALLEQALLRQLGVVKFEKASEMYFTRPALEQASAQAVAHHRANRFLQAGVSTIADLGCSIGGDAIALAQNGRVTGIDWDPVRLAMAQENVRVHGRGHHFEPLLADIASMTPTKFEALFFDPARRDERGRRFFSVHQYQPPLQIIHQWRQMVPETAVKVSPGIDYAEIPAEAEIEFVFLQRGSQRRCFMVWRLTIGRTEASHLPPRQPPPHHGRSRWPRARLSTQTVSLRTGRRCHTGPFGRSVGSSNWGHQN